MAIPKIIHYVWMGNNPKSKDIQRCMRSWERHLQGYKIIEWNENNFDIEKNAFVKAAYEQKKWAFVSDYVRMDAIYRYGGIYLDTDVLVLDNLESFLDHRAFVGFETPTKPFTAVFGAEPKHPLMQDMLTYYDKTEFEYDKNNPLEKVNTTIVGDLLIEKYGLDVNNEMQKIREEIQVYPDYILCNPSLHSSAIHIFTSTWRDDWNSASISAAKFLKLRLTTKKRAEIYKRIIELKHKL